MYIVTITERTPTEPEKLDTNTYHVICESWQKVQNVVENFDLNFGCLVSITITPFKK